MQPFPVSDLIGPAVVIATAGFALCLIFTKRPTLSLCVAGLKAGLFFLYFGFVFNGTYTFLDDWTYLHVGQLLASKDIGIFNFSSNHAYVLSTVKSENLSYYVYNSSAISLFGPQYYAPVTLNILLTLLTAGFLTKTVQSGLDMSRRNSVGLFILLALSPSTLAWSTVTNVKDILVAAGTAIVVYAVALVDSGNAKRALLVAAPGVIILMLTRFYIPLTLGAAFALAMVSSRRVRFSPQIWLVAIAAFIAVIEMLGHGSLLGALSKLRASTGNPVTGVLRFVLTPIPFHTEASYGFLNIPQLIYWMLLPLQMYGIYFVWKKKTMTGHFIVIYFLMMTLLYGMVTTLQGPRHRIQIDGLIVIFQCYGLLALIRRRFRYSPRPGSASSQPFHGAQKYSKAFFRQPKRGA